MRPGRVVMAMTIEKIISGGQTGVDRAALDVARACGIPIGGWCPKGRGAEDGVIITAYPLTETPSADPEERTGRNVGDATATLVLVMGVLVEDRADAGTRHTLRVARDLGRPWRSVDLGDPLQRADVVAVTGWLEDNRVRVLNIAGPRESNAPGIYRAASAYLQDLFRQLGY